MKTIEENTILKILKSCKSLFRQIKTHEKATNRNKIRKETMQMATNHNKIEPMRID